MATANRSSSQDSLVAVFLPAAPHDLLGIDPASGIVGTPTGERVVVDYEGDRYHATEMSRWADRIDRAYGRHKDRYPTIARSLLRPDQLCQVGWYDPHTGEVSVDPEHRSAVAEWVGVEPTELGEQLCATGARHQMRREIAAAYRNPATRHAARQLARRYNIDV